MTRRRRSFIHDAVGGVAGLLIEAGVVIALAMIAALMAIIALWIF